jgi:hypothetical protein
VNRDDPWRHFGGFQGGEVANFAENKMILRSATTRHYRIGKQSLYPHRQKHEHGKFEIPDISHWGKSGSITVGAWTGRLFCGTQKPARPIASK